jgi:hypothetical protein
VHRARFFCVGAEAQFRVKGGGLRRSGLAASQQRHAHMIGGGGYWRGSSGSDARRAAGPGDYARAQPEGR